MFRNHDVLLAVCTFGGEGGGAGELHKWGWVGQVSWTTLAPKSNAYKIPPLQGGGVVAARLGGEMISLEL